MLSLFRSMLNTWVARLFFLVMVVAFGSWGVSDMLSQIGQSQNIATVNGTAIKPAAFLIEYNRRVKQAQAQENASSLSVEAKRGLAQETVQQMIYSAAVDQAANKLNLAVSDDEIRQQVWGVKAFHDATGKFSQTTFQEVLQENGLTSDNFLAVERRELLEGQLLNSLETGAGTSDTLTNRIFAYEAQTRLADVVLFNRSTQPQPADPTDLQLQRFYANHLNSYATPEFRKIKLVVLTPDTLARSEKATDADARKLYDSESETYNKPEKRTVRILVIADQAKAKTLADAWAKNPDWDVIQKQASVAGGSAVEVADTTQKGFPITQLGDAVFAAQPNQIIGPVQAGLGWDVAIVTKVTAASYTSFDAAKADLLATIAKQKAQSAIYDQANKLEDAIGSSSDLSQVPAEIGAAAAEGTLDNNGLDLQGNQAPLPASGDVRAAILTDAFATQLNQPAEFKEVPGKTGGPSGFYALTVEQITPSSHLSFDQAKDKVKSDWIAEQQRHGAETAAAQLLATNNGSPSLATAAGVIHSKPVFRDGAPTDLPAQVTEPLFGLSKNGDATMVQTADGYAVIQLTRIVSPGPADDLNDWTKLHAQLVTSMRADIENTYTDALRAQSKISVNQALLSSTIQ